MLKYFQKNLIAKLVPRGINIFYFRRVWSQFFSRKNLTANLWRRLRHTSPPPTGSSGEEGGCERGEGRREGGKGKREGCGGEDGERGKEDGSGERLGGTAEEVKKGDNLQKQSEFISRE